MFPGQIAATTPDKPAVIMASTSQVITYKELDEAANRLSQLLYHHGFRARRKSVKYLHRQIGAQAQRTCEEVDRHKNDAQRRWEYPSGCWQSGADIPAPRGTAHKY